MNVLCNLIQKLCFSVEFKPLEKCCKVLDNKRKPVTKAARKTGKFPYYGANGIQDYVSDYIFDGVFVLVGEDGSVINQNGTPVVNWAEGKIWVNNHAHIITEANGVLLRYLYHYLQTVNIKPLIHGNIPKLTGGDFKALEIPIPPLAVQEEIVRILDKFTELEAELEAELEKEQEARKKQYEWYRDRLLSFDEGVPVTTLNEIFNTRNGYTPSKTKAEFWEQGTIPWFRLEDVRENGTILTDALQHVTPAAIKGSLFPANSIIVATSATIGVHALITEKSIANQRFTCLMLKEKYKNLFDMKFLYYYCFKLDEYCKEHLNQGNFASVDMAAFSKFQFPIPPIEDQQRIVDILDRLDTLCNDITTGLPAEIAARRKQYEYYRDKLLSFEEVA